MVTSRGADEDTTSVLVASGTSFVVSYDSTSGGSNAGSNGSGRNPFGASFNATVPASISPIRPVVPSAGIVAYGVTPFRRLAAQAAKRSSSGLLGDSLGSEDA